MLQKVCIVVLAARSKSGRLHLRGHARTTSDHDEMFPIRSERDVVGLDATELRLVDARRHLFIAWIARATTAAAAVALRTTRTRRLDLPHVEAVEVLHIAVRALPLAAAQRK